MLRVRSWLLLLILSCCAGSLADSSKVLEDFVEYHLIIDHSFSIYQKEIIINSCRRWSKISEKKVLCSSEEDLDPDYSEIDDLFNYTTKDVSKNKKNVYVWKGNSKDENFRELEKIEGKDRFAILGYAPGYILIVEDRINSSLQFKQVALHEMGHILGMKHIKTVMNPVVETYCMSRYDLIQFCELYGCDSKKFEESLCF